MSKIRRKNYKETSKVMLWFSLLVFFVLVVTMLIVGFSMYTLFKIQTITIASVETFTLLAGIFLISSIIIGTLLSILIGKIVLKDLDKVVDGMETLSQGDYTTRIPEGKSGLAKDIVSQFNVLASELENVQTLRADFINDYAHEFKTPIVSLLGFAKILKNEKLSEEQKKEYLLIIEEEAERLSKLSTNSLNLTKVEKQSILEGQTNFNLAEQIRNCVLLFEKKWSAKKLDLEIDLDETNVFANEEMLKQVWINLIDNAIKFSYPNEKLFIKLTKKDNQVEFVIKDKGDIIPEEEIENVFKRFYRSRNANGIEGNGVGLAIVKKIINLHDGQVSVTSEDGFTEFKVLL